LNITVDIGNSSAKAALFDEGRLVEAFPIANYKIAERSTTGRELRITNCDKVIMVSTRGEVPEIERVMREKAGRFVKFDHTTPVPIKNLYGTPETLGYDRLAAAVGANAVYPGENVLIVDFGTAITYDVVTAAGEFLGGNISPGAGMRFRALSEQTATLPLGGLPEAMPEFPAKSTREAIESGVAMGIVAETEYYAGVAKHKYGEIKIIFTGGDADYFVRRVNFPIFATSDLVFYGLNAILEYNGASHTGNF
jgi:type III pantothenate kinase